MGLIAMRVLVAREGLFPNGYSVEWLTAKSIPYSRLLGELRRGNVSFIEFCGENKVCGHLKNPEGFAFKAPLPSAEAAQVQLRGAIEEHNTPMRTR